MAGRDPEYVIRRAVNLQDWVDLTFLHWRVDADAVQRRLPRGLEVEVLDGDAWLAVVPFRMRDVRMPGLPAHPRWSTFPECNVRTYVRGSGGRTGVWFFRLVCPRRSFVRAMRLVGLPYVHAASSAVIAPDGVHTYAFAGLGADRDERLEAHTTVGPAIADADRSELLDALTGRWGTWGVVGGRLVHVPVEHPPWPLHEATVDLAAVPRDVVGLTLPGTAPLVHFSPGVSTRVGLPTRG